MGGYLTSPTVLKTKSDNKEVPHTFGDKQPVWGKFRVEVEHFETHKVGTTTILL